MIEKNKILILSTFFAALLISGLVVYDDYGVHWDEYHNQKFGNKWFNYIENTIEQNQLQKTDNLSRHDVTHGPTLDIILIAIEKLLKVSNSRDVILLRHLCIFLLFYLSVIVFYLLCKSGFGSWKIGLAGCILLVIHPRISSHAFYNTSDIGFLSFYIISAYTSVRLLKDKSYGNAVLHALASAMVVDIRLAGLIVPFCTCVFYVLGTLPNKDGKKAWSVISIYVLSFIALSFLFSPVFWESPIANFLMSLKSSTGVDEHWKGTPWTYNFTWIAATTPIVYILFFLLGCFSYLKLPGTSVVQFCNRSKTHLLVMALLILPIVIPIALNTRLYGGWRHHYFIYPMFVYVSLAGFMYMRRLVGSITNKEISRIVNLVTITILAGSVVSTLHFIVKHHPHQGGYVNNFADERRSLDYWGLSYRNVMEHILKNNPGIVKIYAMPRRPGKNNLNILPPGDRERLQLVKELEDADYIITNFKRYKIPPGYEEYYAVRIGTRVIAGVYKIKGSE